MNNEGVPDGIGNEFPITGSMQVVARKLFNLDIVENTPDWTGRANERHSVNI